MGIKFLKHISRTSGLAFLIDLSDDDYCDSYDKLQKELDGFSPLLAEKPRVVIANKLDLPDTRERLAELRARYPEQRIFGISVHSRWGLDEVRDAFIAMVNDSINGDVTDGNDQIPDFMQAEPEEVPNPLPELDPDDFGATVSLNRKKRRRTR